MMIRQWQEDLFLANLSVAEDLKFQANFRLHHLSQQDQEKRVEQAITSMRYITVTNIVTNIDWKSVQPHI